MSDFDVLVRSAFDVGISEGRIAAVGENLRGSAVEEIDATNLTVFPGLIDAHVHFNEPGRTEWEGFTTGSRAAAAGGTTTVFDMPLNAHPPTVDAASFDAKCAAAEKVSLVDFALWGGLVPGNVDELESLCDRGVVGVKAFMSNSGIADFEAVDERTLRDGMRRAAELGIIVAVHAESETMTRDLTERARAAGKTSVHDYLETRPVEVEVEAIRHAIELAAETTCKLHIVHVSCGRGVRMVADARAGGVDVTCETCPHYLSLTEEDMIGLGAVAKCAPPLRSADDQHELWMRLGDVDTIGSDHSPSLPEMKERNDFFDVWGGISGCQHVLSLLVERVAFSEIARLTSEGVAQRFRLARKGGFGIGKDADLTLLDLNADDKITAESLHYRHRQSPYVGRTVKGRIARTLLRGQTIFADGNFADRPCGRFVRPEQS